MSRLTEEQRQLIEENKRKALERRAALQQKQILHTNLSVSTASNNQQSSSSVCSISTISSFYQTKPSDPLNQVKVASSDGVRKNYLNNAPLGPVSSVCQQTSGCLQSSTWESGTKKRIQATNQTITHMKSVAPVPVGKILTGSFCLLTKERFYVEAGYHAQMIEIFKTRPTRNYDIATKKWSFSLQEHDSLVTALQPLRPHVCVSPLPHIVRTALDAAKKYPPLCTVDLMGLNPSLLEALLPFQRDGICFGITRHGKVLIADDMGLGKTIQALGIACYYKDEWLLLIVTPSSVRYSWADSVQKWIPSVSPYDISIVESGKDNFSSASVVIVSYDMLAKRAKEFQERRFQLVIMDESHMLKGFKTARYKAAAPIMRMASRCVLLSGTPVLSRPSELYTQISGIDRKLFPNFQEYGVRYCGGHMGPWGWDFTGSTNMEELQIILENTIMIRRMKASVLSQLPSKQRMTIMLDPSSIKSSNTAMAEAAKQFNLRSKSAIGRDKALLDYFAKTAVAKTKAVSEYAKELLESGQKFLIYAHHKVMIDSLCDACNAAKVKYIRITGSTQSEARQQLIDTFQNKEDVRVAVLSLTAANTGITLTAASLVVFAELFWNPGTLVQAEDRVHRIGQDDCVMVQYLVAKGTADDFIWPLVQQKLDMLNKAGLSKDDFSSADSKKQQAVGQNSIKKYLLSTVEDDVDLSELDSPFPLTDQNSSSEPETKKLKL